MIKALPQTREAGFTLLEMLLAISLLGVIMGLAYGGFSSATKTTYSGERFIQQNQNMRMVHQFVRRQLGRMLPLSYVNDSDGLFVVEGESDRITYVAPMPGYLGFGGTQVQQLELARAREGYQLLFRHAVLAGYEEGDLDDQEPIVLMENIADGSFEYIGIGDSGELEDWGNNWEYTDRLPEAVALRMDFPDQGRLRWPDLVALKRVDGFGVTGRVGGLQQHIQQLINQRRNTRNRREKSN